MADLSRFGAGSRTRRRPPRTRAAAVIPGGMYGHMNATRLPDGYPQFFARARGHARLGRRRQRVRRLHVQLRPDHPRPHAPARSRPRPRRRLPRATRCNGPGAVHGRAGRAARRHASRTPTGRCSPRTAPTPRPSCAHGRARRRPAGARCWWREAPTTARRPGARRSPPASRPRTARNMHPLRLQRPGQRSRRAASRRRRRPRRDHRLAVPPRRAARPGDCRSRVRPRAARSVRPQLGAALILDDVRAGFRLDLGGSWEPLGVEPDLSGWSKAHRQRLRPRGRLGNDARSARRVAQSSPPARSGSGRADGGRDRHDQRAARRATPSPSWSAPAGRLRDGLAAQAPRHGVADQPDRPGADAVPDLRRRRGLRQGDSRSRPRCSARRLSCTRGTTGSSPPRTPTPTSTGSSRPHHAGLEAVLEVDEATR